MKQAALPDPPRWGLKPEVNQLIGYSSQVGPLKMSRLTKRMRSCSFRLLKESMVCTRMIRKVKASTFKNWKQTFKKLQGPVLQSNLERDNQVVAQILKAHQESLGSWFLKPQERRYPCSITKMWRFTAELQLTQTYVGLLWKINKDLFNPSWIKTSTHTTTSRLSTRDPAPQSKGGTSAKKPTGIVQQVKIYSQMLF